MRRSGLVLIEALLVIAIMLGIMASAFKLQQWVTNKRDALRVQSDLATIAQKLEEYHLFNGDYPYIFDNQQHNVVLKEVNFEGQEGRLEDPWGNIYYYKYKKQADDTAWVYSGFKLWSAGPDSQTSEDGYMISSTVDGVMEDIDNIVYF